MGQPTNQYQKKRAISGRHTPHTSKELYEAQYARIRYTHPDSGLSTYPCLPPRATYKYLGVHISLSLEWKTNASHLMEAVRKKITKLKHSWATPDQRAEIIKSAIIPKATYAAATGIMDLKQLHILDTLIGTSMKEASGIGKSAKRDFSFSPIKTERGRLRTPIGPGPGNQIDGVPHERHPQRKWGHRSSGQRHTSSGSRATGLQHVRAPT